MICPFCGANDDKVIDSRPTEGEQAIRRRRECLRCGQRFSTYERVEQASRLTVVKKDGKRDPFDSEKIVRSITAATGKRPISADTKLKIAHDIEEELRLEYDREAPSSVIGERVMARLREADRLSYIRYAIEQMAFSSVDDIRNELDELEDRPPVGVDHPPLFDNGKPESKAKPKRGGPR